MEKKSNDEMIKLLKLLIIFFIIILIVLSAIIIIVKNKEDENTVNTEQVQIEKESMLEELSKQTEESVVIDRLSTMEERDRMEYYFSTFVRAIESSNYEKAYNMLYDEFKKNYFPTLEQFQLYAQKTFPKMMSIEHTNIERNGNTYVLFVTISSSLSTSGEGKEINVIIREDDINDFVMSFSVI